jgi:hypothetical protein
MRREPRSRRRGRYQTKTRGDAISETPASLPGVVSACSVSRFEESHRTCGNVTASSRGVPAGAAREAPPVFEGRRYRFAARGFERETFAASVRARHRPRAASPRERRPPRRRAPVCRPSRARARWERPPSLDAERSAARAARGAAFRFPDLPPDLGSSPARAAPSSWRPTRAERHPRVFPAAGWTGTARAECIPGHPWNRPVARGPRAPLERPQAACVGKVGS